MKLEIDKDWCLAAAEREGDSEVGAGALAMDPVDVNSREAALWSENMKLKSENEYYRTILTGIAVMDVYTRDGEQPASEVMRAAAKTALEKHQ